MLYWAIFFDCLFRVDLTENHYQQVVHPFNPIERNTVKRPARFTGIAAAFIAIGVVLSGCTFAAEPEDPLSDFDFGDCTPVIAAVSPEKVNMFTELSQMFEKSEEAKALKTCARVAPVDVSSGEANRLLKAGWPTDQTVKPQPVLWSPASTSWINDVADSKGENLVPNAQSFARTPVVFAMPEPMARTLGWPDEPLGISDLHDLCLDPQGWGKYGGAAGLWGSFRIGKTNPNTSTTGLNTLLMQSYAASGKQTGLTEDDVAAAAQFSEEFESCVIHYGDTTGSVLQRVYDRDQQGQPLDYVSAIAVEETSVINYNIGNPTSAVIKVDDKGQYIGADEPVEKRKYIKPPSEKLVAIYPEEGSLQSDNPIVALGGPDAPWVTEEQRVAGEAFIKFVLSSQAQEVLDDFGFRKLDPNAKLAGLFTPENGVDPSLPAIMLEQPSVSVVATAKDQWEQIRKPSSVLVLVDVSGSMSDDAGTGRSKMKEAIESAQATLGHFRSTDELGVWAFTTGVESAIGKNLVEIRQVKPMAGESEQLSREMGNLTPQQGTPLYDAVSTAYQYMSDRAEPGRINAIVVLSDGEDTDSTTSIDKLLREMRNESEGGDESLVRVFPISYGQAVSVPLTDIAEASGGQVFDASDARRIKLIFQSVVNNF